MIGILVPTRALLFTETAEAIEKMRREDRSINVYYKYDLPIPDSYNTLVEEALKDGATHFLFIEEDVVPPEGVLQKLSNAIEDITFIDYSVNGWSCITKDKNGKILWAGLGCTMVKRNVFEKLEKPWFRTDKGLRLNDMQWIDANPNQAYGGQDIWFFTKAREAGCTIKQIEGKCKHLQLEELGKKGFNNGFHKITERKPITNYNIL